MHSLRYNYLPESFNNILKLKSDIAEHRVREDLGNFDIPSNHLNIKFPRLNAAQDWNSLPHYYKTITKLSTLKKD